MSKKYKTDTKYNSTSRPRGKIKQIGASLPYNSYNRPLLERLEIYDNTYRYEPVIQQSVNIMIDAVIGALGSVEHPDPEIEAYLQDTLNRQEEEYSINILDKLREVMRTTMRFGFSVTENLMTVENGVLFLRDYVTYHPNTIILRTDVHGQLVDNKPAYEGPYLKSGIYQTTHTKYNEVLLPRWKVALLTFNKEFNNYYGTSIVENSYRWHVLKEAFTDMMTTALDRYGNPLTLITIPKFNTDEVRTNPVTGETRTMSLQELVEEQIRNNYTPSHSNFLFLPFTDQTNRPQATVISGASNLGTVFLDAIKYCEDQMTRNLFIPFNILNGTGNNDDTQSERQIEIFNRVIVSLYRMMVVPFVNQTLHQLVKFNFTRESAKTPPKIPLRKTTRPEARVALMQMIKGLTETGFLNPTNESDWTAVREMVDALDRPLEKDDIEFIKKILIEPRQKPEPAAPEADGKKPTNKKAAAKQRTNPNKTPSGTGNMGRPTGVVTPLQNARLRKRSA